MSESGLMFVLRGAVGIAVQGSDFGGEVDIFLDVEVFGVRVEVFNEIGEGRMVWCRQWVSVAFSIDSSNQRCTDST